MHKKAKNARALMKTLFWILIGLLGHILDFYDYTLKFFGTYDTTPERCVLTIVVAKMSSHCRVTK